LFLNYLSSVTHEEARSKVIATYFYSLLHFDDTFLARKWTVGGPVGPVGVVVHQVFAREISVFEQELAPTRYQVTMGSSATEKVQRERTV